MSPNISSAGALLQATVEDFVEAVQTSGVVHVSSHAGASQLEPMMSSISLSDGMVDVSDILRLPGLDCSLVTLSSCQSGLSGSLTLADEFLSLQSALLYSGARLTVGTLWPIMDIVGLAFFSHFYRRLSAMTVRSFDLESVWEVFNTDVDAQLTPGGRTRILQRRKFARAEQLDWAQGRC